MTIVPSCNGVEQAFSLHEMVFTKIKEALDRKGVAVDSIDHGSFEGRSDETSIEGRYKRISEETLDEATFKRLFLEAFQDCPKTFQETLSSKHAVSARHKLGKLTLFVEIILKKEEGKIYPFSCQESGHLEWNELLPSNVRAIEAT